MLVVRFLRSFECLNSISASKKPSLGVTRRRLGRVTLMQALQVLESGPQLGN